jgi:lipopolysaccharide transport system ATP-binding protein
MGTVIKVENLGKQYRLGEVGTGTLSHDLNRWMAKIRGKEDPFSKVGEANDRTKKGESDYVWALRDVNFEVQAGEVLGIIGRNGAGKSTLLKILSKVTKPTTGQIKTRGRIASLLEVGTGFHPEMTGRENTFLNGAIMGMTKAEVKSKFDEIVDFAGVERYIDTPVKRYSSGMYVRLAFAVAAHLEPEILVVDEVLAVGDAEFQKKCLGKMKDVSVNDGRTVLFVSHNMGAVQALCTKSILMANGRVTFAGSQTEGVTRYLEKTRENYIDLPDVGHRMGTGEIRISKIYFRNEIGQIIDNTMSGQTFDICLDYQIKPNAVLTNIVVSISVGNQLDQPVFLFHNRLTGDDLGIIEKDGTFICTIKKNPLIPSLYSLSFAVMCENGKGGYIDHLANAQNFSVIEGDFYKSGETTPSSHGLVMIEGHWRRM